MATSTPARPNELEQLARSRFDSLSEAETKMIRAACVGEVAFCGTSPESDQPSNNNPVNPKVLQRPKKA